MKKPGRDPGFFVGKSNIAYDIKSEKGNPVMTPRTQENVLPAH